MKNHLLLIVLSCLFLNTQAQVKPDEGGAFFLHKFEQNIGEETYKVSRSSGVITYMVDFKFVDRGAPVPLKAELKLTQALEPLELTVKGNIARSATINDKVTIKDGTAHIQVNDSAYDQKIVPFAFPVAGYSPGTVQQVLVQYWESHHQPATISTLPYGSVQIKKDGLDTVIFENKPLLLNRFTISGLIWGNELLWTDQKSEIICLITNDAEADKLEMMREQYESLLPTMISRAATYSMHLFAKATGSSVASFTNKTLIVEGTMLDVIDRKAIPNSVIVIENGIITKIGKAGSIKIPTGAKVINAGTKMILPGLWDMHAHFEQAEWGPAYLAAGVTTVRDCGNEFGYINAIKSSIDKGEGIGPLILKAGIIDGKGKYSLGIIQADTKEEAIQAVDRYKDNGFVQIKIYSSVKPEIVKVICEEAHRLGLTVTGHIPNGMTLQQGVNSGMDMVNHVQYVYSVMKRNKDRSVNFEDSTSIAALNFIKQHHVVIDPTLGVFEMVFRNVKDDITTMEPAFYTFPLPLQALFKNTGEQPGRAAILKPIMDAMKQIVKRMYDDGITIVAGTDQGFPGYSLDRELELYVECGLTPIDAIQTATITPAQVMRMDKSSGSITVGKQADLILVDGDPLSNIRDIRKVTTVIKAGKIYNPVMLHQLVGFSK